MSIRTNDNGYVYLDSVTMTAIFDCVYGINEFLKPRTKELLTNSQFKDYVNLLLAHQNYNYMYRYEKTIELFPLFESTIGPMEKNSEGTTYYLALGLAIKELYGFKKETLKKLLETIDSEILK